MSRQYIYILSNPCFRDGIYKVGFTETTPEKRKKALSRSTSIPSDFFIEFAKEVNDKRVIETRVHLILSSYRINKGKEFFCISLDKIIKAIEISCDYTDNHEGASDTFGLSNDISIGYTDPTLSVNGLDIFSTMLASAADNTHIHHFFYKFVRNYQFSTSYNFLSALNFSNLTKKSHRSSCAALKKFCVENPELKVISHSSREETKVFEKLEYSKGQLLWAFTIEFRDLFTNDKPYVAMST